MRNLFPVGLVMVALFSCSSETNQPVTTEPIYTPFQEPNHYFCRYLPDVQIDGKLTEWEGVEWTDYFGDIEGDEKPEPRLKTRAKMAWNDHFLFIAAELEDPHVWATITERDAVIFYDNDFEVFIDPDGDTHHYYEMEVNAFGTVWDLLLTTPYRDFGHVIDSWDILGIQVGVDVQGTINDPSDKDIGWTVELAIPFQVLEECHTKDGKPEVGDYWRINFSRVQWTTEIQDGKYVKQMDPVTGKTLPEDNWVWSPQYHVNMHMPEYWGYLVFSDSESTAGTPWSLPVDELTKWQLRNFYYFQKQFWQQNNRYARSVAELGWTSSHDNLPVPEYLITFSGFQAYLPGEFSGWVIDEKGWVRKVGLVNE